MLKINQLRKNYGEFSLECTMEVHPGCITGLIGRNGAGKTTTFKAALNLIHLDGGSVELDGKNVKNLTMEEKEKIGVVLSDSGFNGCLTVKDISFILYKMYRDFDREKFYDTCRKQQLPLDKKLKEFSTGMKAKLKLTAALCHDTSLLILDEPTAGMDVIAREEISELLRQYMEEKENRAILISSHISTDLENLCDDLYMIHDGRIVLHEETDVLLDDYGIIKADPEQYEAIEKRYLLRARQEKYGWCCLTNQKQFYLENYPELVVEKSNIDEVIPMMIGGAEK